MQDQVVAVFGGDGFIGRYVVRALLRRGARVRIVSRDPRDGVFLRTQGGIGQTQFVAADVTRPETVERALAGAAAAVYLVGVLDGAFQALHVDGARHVAQAATKAGLQAFVHVSAIGADAASQSAYGRSKGEGEAAVRDAFPRATIVRPSVVFGREDKFINRFADLIRLLPIVPVIGGTAKFQPVYVGDVAEAITATLADPVAHAGKTYELGGPEVISMADLNRWIAKATGRRRPFVPMPDFVASAIATASGYLPGLPITRDQWLMLQSDNVVSGADGLAATGVTPTPLDAIAEGWLVRYRRQGRFAEVTQQADRHGRDTAKTAGVRD